MTLPDSPERDCGTIFEDFSDLEGIPEEQRPVYWQLKEHHKRFDWKAQGKVCRVVDGRLTDEMIVLPEPVDFLGDRIRAIELYGRVVLIHTAIIFEGEVYPVRDNCYLATPKEAA